MAQLLSPIKYQRRSVWAVRTFPKGCGRFAVANPRSVEEPKLTPPPLSPPSSPPPPSPPLLEKAVSPASVSSPHPITSQFNPIVEQNEVFMNRKQFPKRRKVSAIRTFPVGCGREVSAIRIFPVDFGSSESKFESPKPMSIQISNSDKQPSPDTGYDIKTLEEEIASLNEEPKPLQVDATFEIKGLGVTQDERREFGGDNMAIPSPRGIVELQESTVRARKIASKGSIKNQKESSEKRRSNVEPKTPRAEATAVIKNEPKTPRAEATAVIKKEPAEIQKKGKEVKSNKRNLEISELEEESKPRVHSGSKVAGESSTPNQRQSSEKVESVGDRLIVQCLMAAPNCPWRTRGSATPKASRAKAKQAR